VGGKLRIIPEISKTKVQVSRAKAMKQSINLTLKELLRSKGNEISWFFPVCDISSFSPVASTIMNTVFWQGVDLTSLLWLLGCAWLFPNRIYFGQYHFHTYHIWICLLLGVATCGRTLPQRHKRGASGHPSTQPQRTKVLNRLVRPPNFLEVLKKSKSTIRS